MKNISFEWDKNKALENIKKHKISFEEALTVFFDEQSVMMSDPDHSCNEERFLVLGFSQKLRLLIVCHCYREGDKVRIISARKATKRESTDYNKGE